MRIAVFGAGALGGYFGARLAQAGADVRFIARAAHLTALRERGLTVRSVFGDFHADLRATDDPTEIGPVDFVLFTVKSYDTVDAAGRLAPLLRPAEGAEPATAIVSFQNGIDNEEKIADVVGWQHVVGGVAYVFANVAEPGVIDHTGGPTSLVFGEFGGERSARVERLLELCRRAEVKAEIADDIRVALWTKYVFICAQAGMTAATRLPIGVIRETPPTWAMFRAILEEGWLIARAEGVDLPGDLVERHLAFAAGLQPEGYSSLYNDLVSGRRMELEALHGELVRRAARAGIDAPASRAVYALLSPWAAQAVTGQASSAG